jgi:hypothetical protein
MPGAPLTDPSRAEELSKCEAFASALCAKQASCVGATGSNAACTSEAVGPGRFDCGHVTSVSADYDRCLGDISHSGCPLALPASCKTVLRYGGTPASNGSGSGGAGSYRCDASGIYEICDGAVCHSETVTSFWFGSTELEAGVKAVANCNDFMNNLVIANNIAYHARVIASCLVIGCSRQ